MVEHGAGGAVEIIVQRRQIIVERRFVGQPGRIA
jgi:hypothetical protein